MSPTLKREEPDFRIRFSGARVVTAPQLDVLEKIAELLKREFNPSKLYLFGSRANGTAHGESDYDFVMVLPRFRGDRLKTWETCNKLIYRTLGVQADVFAYSEKEFERNWVEFSTIAETAFSTGKEIDLGAP